MFEFADLSNIGDREASIGTERSSALNKSWSEETGGFAANGATTMTTFQATSNAKNMCGQNLLLLPTMMHNINGNTNAEAGKTKLRPVAFITRERGVENIPRQTVSECVARTPQWAINGTRWPRGIDQSIRRKMLNEIIRCVMSLGLS